VWPWRRIINAARVTGEQIPVITVQRISVLLNPRAGNWGAATAEDVTAAFRAARCAVDVRVTDGASIVAAAVDALKGGSNVIVAGGGDGTVSAAASVLAGTDAALGVIPLGTLNHFSKDLGIPHDLGEAAQAIAAGRR